MSDKPAWEFECSLQNAPRFWYWIRKRKGLAKWNSIDLSDLGKSWTSPVIGKDGNRITKPHWKSADEPALVCTNPDEVMIVTDKEVKRFRVALRMGSQGMTLKCTDASSAKIRRTLAAINDTRDDKAASYHFDYDMQEAVFTVPDKVITLTQWAKEYPELSAKSEAGDPAVLG